MAEDREKLAREFETKTPHDFTWNDIADIAIAYADRRVAEAVQPLQKRLDDFDRDCTWYWDAEDPEECILEPTEHLDNGAGCGVIVELQRGGVFETRWWFQYFDAEEEYTTVSFASKEEAEAALSALSPAQEGGQGR